MTLRATAKLRLELTAVLVGLIEGFSAPDADERLLRLPLAPLHPHSGTSVHFEHGQVFGEGRVAFLEQVYVSGATESAKLASHERRWPDVHDGIVCPRVHTSAMCGGTVSTT